MFKVNFKIVWTIVAMLFTLAISAQEICNNGIDDDGNGLIDLNDTTQCGCDNIVPLTDVTGNPCRRIDLTLDLPDAISYQWYKDGVALDNELDSEIEIHKFAPLGDGTYQVIVITPTGCVASEPYDVMAEEFNTDLGEISLCEGDTIVIGGFPFFKEGRQQFKTSTSEGCDSLVALEIVFVPFSRESIEVTQCTGSEYISPSGQVITQPGSFSDTLRAVAGCDSLIISIDLDFEDLEPVELFPSICSGDVFIFKDIEETDPGTYMTNEIDAFGCDSIFIITLDVRPPLEGSMDASICAGGLFELGDISTNQPGMHQTTLLNSEGCDSIVTVMLTVDPAEEVELDMSTCPSIPIVIFGEEYDTEGTFTFMNPTGECDTMFTLNLTIDDLPRQVEEVTICEGELFEWRGTEYGQAIELEEEEEIAGACNILHVLMLEVTDPEVNQTTETICEGLGFEWRGQMYFEDTEIEETVEVLGECTVIERLSLTVTPPDPIMLEETICAGDTYEEFGFKEDKTGIYERTEETAGECNVFYSLNLTVMSEAVGQVTAELCPGETYELFDLSTTDLGSHIAMTTTPIGCDSIIMVELVSGFTAPVTVIDSICEGDQIIFEGQSFTEEGTHEVLLTSASGCDSLMILELSFRDEIAVMEDVSICMGETYIRHDLELTETGVFMTTVETLVGCDSLITINLTVNEPTSSDMAVTICEDDVFELFDVTAMTTGSYVATTSNAVGCDSIINIELTVYEDTMLDTISADICTGETYTFADVVATEPGTYPATLQSVTGCDSTVIIELEVLPLQEREMIVEICPGDTIQFFGTDITLEGEYTERIQNVTGCDSIVTLILQFDPIVGDLELEEEQLVNLGSSTDVEPLFVDANFVSFQWFNALGEIISTDMILTDYTPEGDTFLELQANTLNGCSVRERIRINVELVVEIYTPNVISPNSDDANSYFTVGATESVIGIEQLAIYDRWGEEVFVDSHEGRLNTYIGWDGTFKGRKVQPAVFTYFAVFNIIDGSTRR